MPNLGILSDPATSSIVNRIARVQVMARAEIYWIPGLDNARLAIMPRPNGNEWLAQEVRSWEENGINRIVSLLEERETTKLNLENEANECEQNNILFTSFPIQDCGIPESLPKAAQLVRSIELDLLQGQSVGIHCRAGIGCSGLIAGCVLVNLGVPTPDIFPRISRGRGIEVPDTDAQCEWLTKYAKERRWADWGYS